MRLGMEVSLGLGEFVLYVDLAPPRKKGTVPQFSALLCKRKPRRQCTGALYVQNSPDAAALSTSFLLNHAPQQP